MIARLIGFLFLFSTFIPASIVYAESSIEQLSENWSMQATQIVEWVEQEKWLEAKEQLAKLAKEFSQSDLAKKDWDVQEIQLLSSVILQLDRKLNQVSPDKESIQFAAKQLQLAFDAISHPHQPLWQQMYQPLVSKLSHYQEANRQGDKEKMNQLWKEIKRDFQLIRPGLVLSKSPYTVAKIDSLINAIEKTPNIKDRSGGIDQLFTLIRPLFFGSEKDVLAVVDPIEAFSLELMIIVICLFMLLVLTYVSWRKYQGRRKHVA
ncbi:sporulation protein YpjB [Seinonella peptonophila]|nr:sporulation protein YpjB [Seinonella peptonophila]